MSYEFDGEKYQKASAHQKEWGSRLIADLDLKGSERILDLGCGDGGLTAQLAARVPEGRVLGIDASLGMIDTAKKHEGENLQFVLKNINELDFEEEFDVVFSNATLNWVKEHHSLLKGVFRALRSGGYLRFNFAGDGNCSRFIKVIREAMVHSDFHKYFCDFDWPWFMPSVREYEGLMSKSPFREHEVWGENEDRFFPDIETMVRWVDQPSIVPFLSLVEETDKEAFRTYVVQKMIEEAGQPDGTCFETFRRLNVVASKP